MVAVGTEAGRDHAYIQGCGVFQSVNGLIDKLPPMNTEPSRALFGNGGCDHVRRQSSLATASGTLDQHRATADEKMLTNGVDDGGLIWTEFYRHRSLISRN